MGCLEILRVVSWTAVPWAVRIYLINSTPVGCGPWDEFEHIMKCYDMIAENSMGRPMSLLSRAARCPVVS